jgi:hypothetical protein
MQRAGRAFYEIDPTTGATIEIFFADRVVTQSRNPTSKVFDLPQVVIGCYSFTQHALRVW